MEEDDRQRLRVRPLFPLAADRKLARDTQRIAGYFPDTWITRSNQKGTLRVSRWPVIEMAVIAVLGSVILPSVWMLGRWLLDPVLTLGVIEMAVVTVLGAGVIAVVVRSSPMGFYKRRVSLLVAGGGSGAERRGVILHELGHRMQEVIPGLVGRERAFLEAKLGRPTKVYGRLQAFLRRALRLPKGDGSLNARSVSRYGVYVPYTVFDPMDGHAYEVFTTGLEGMYYGAKNPWTGRFDPELRPFEDHQEFVRRCLEEL